MNREILFRGKKIDNGEWIESFSIMQLADGTVNLGSWIINPVIPETVGQFTGLTDKNGVKIFEGDKFSDDDNEGGYFLIEWSNKLSKFCVNLYSYAMNFNEGGGEVFDSEISLVDENIIDVIDLKEDFIIGNIHDKLTLQNENF